jgi:AcrR family transcriptional regulator
MPAIAAETGVVVETIYRAFGSKARLFKAVIESALAGGSKRAEAPPEGRPAIRAVIEETDPRRKLELYAATQLGVHYLLVGARGWPSGTYQHWLAAALQHELLEESGDSRKN